VKVFDCSHELGCKAPDFRQGGVRTELGGNYPQRSPLRERPEEEEALPHLVTVFWQAQVGVIEVGKELEGFHKLEG